MAPTVFGHTGEDEQPAGTFPSILSGDPAEVAVARMWDFADAHGIIPLRANEVAARAGAGRSLRPLPIASPDGEHGVLWFDVTSAEPGAFVKLAEAFRELGLA